MGQVSDCCLMPNVKISATGTSISWREQVAPLMRWWWCQLCTRPTRNVGLPTVLAEWNKSAGWHVAPPLSWFRDNQSLILCSQQNWMYDVHLLYGINLLHNLPFDCDECYGQSMENVALYTGIQLAVAAMEQ